MSGQAVPILQWLARIGVAGVFLFAGVPKIIDPGAFLAAVEAYRLLPYGLAVATALYLPWLEVVAAIVFLVPGCFRAAGVAILGMLAVFVVALTSALARGLDISCGCFSSDPSASSSLIGQLVLDLFLIAATVFAMLRFSSKPSVRP